MTKPKFDIIITKSAGNKVEQKVQLMKAIMSINPMGLRRSTDIVDNPPGSVLRGVGRGEANKAKKILEKAGATVEVRQSTKRK